MSDAPYTRLAVDDTDTTDTDEVTGFLHGARDASGLRRGAWDAPLFGCFRHLVPNCLLATFCSCIPIAQVAHRLGVARFGVVLLSFVALQALNFVLGVFTKPLPSPNPEPTPEPTPWTPLRLLSLEFSLYYTAGVTLFLWHLRAKTRRRFQIPGSVLADACTSLWCQCCAIAQMATHVRSYEPGHCDFGPPDVLPPYTA